MAKYQYILLLGSYALIKMVSIKVSKSFLNHLFHCTLRAGITIVFIYSKTLICKKYRPIIIATDRLIPKPKTLQVEIPVMKHKI